MRHAVVLLALPLLACGTQAQAAAPTPSLPHYAADRGERDLSTPRPVATPTQVAPPTTPAPRVESAPPPLTYRLRIVGPGVNAPIVGTVGAPCTAPRPPVPYGGAYFDGCNQPTWVMAHPRFFGAMNTWGLGTEVTYWDASSTPHVAHVVANRVFGPGSTVWTAAGWLHLQVCTDDVSNSNVRVLDAA